MTWTHLVSLGVGVDNPEHHQEIFDELTQLGSRVATKYTYVSVSSTANDVDYEEDDTIETPDECNEEHLYYDGDTMRKVYAAIAHGVYEVIYDEAPSPGRDPRVDAIVNQLQNAGIIFRERAPENS